MNSALSTLLRATCVALLTLLASCQKPDTVDSLSAELVVKIEELSAAIDTVTDKPSAEKAAQNIDTIGDDFLLIAERFEALGELSDEDKKAVGDKMLQSMRTMNDKREESLKRITDGESAVILGKAIVEFGDKTKGVEEQFRIRSQ